MNDPSGNKPHRAVDDQPTDAERQDAALEDQELMGRSATLIAGMWNSAQMVIPLVGTTVVSIVIGRFLGPTELGEQSWISYVEGLLVALLIQTLVRAGIQTMATAKGASDTAGYNAVARWTMWGQVTGGVISAIVLLGFSVFSEYPSAWYFVSATAAINAIGWAYSTRIIAATGWRRVAQRRLVTQLLAQILAVVAVVYGFGIVGVFAANAAAAIVLTIMVWRLADPVDGPLLPALPRQLLRIWGLYLLTELLVQVVARRIEFVFLGAFSTKEQLAMYSIPYMVVTSVIMIPDSMMTAILPSLASQAGAGRGDVVNRHLTPAVRVAAMVALPLTAGIAVLGPRLVTMLYGQDFAEAGRLVSWMALLVIFVPVYDLLNIYWGGFGRLGVPLVAVAIGGVFDLGLAFALVPHYGAFGATIANVTGQAITAAILIGITRSRVPTLSMAWGRYAVIAVVSGAAAGAGWFLQSRIEGLPGWLLAFAVMVIILGAFGSLVGFTTKQDAGWLRDSVPAKLRRFLPFYTGHSTSGTAH